MEGRPNLEAVEEEAEVQLAHVTIEVDKGVGVVLERPSSVREVWTRCGVLEPIQMAYLRYSVGLARPHADPACGSYIEHIP